MLSRHPERTSNAHPDSQELDLVSPTESLCQHHAESIETARAAVFVGAHSFLVLAIAISLGPLSAHATRKQTTFGLLLALGGIALSGMQAKAGAYFINETKRQTRHVLPGQGPASVIAETLPRFLFVFWVALSVWVCWER